MIDKSHVTMEQQACLVCCKMFDTGSILLDKRLRPRFEHHTVTGWGFCPEHRKLKDDGFVALIEIDPDKSGSQPYKPHTVWRTGTLAHVRAEVWAHIFDVPLPDEGLCFVEPGLIAMLERKREE